MKVIGWILLIFGALALIGSLAYGNGSVMGSAFWTAVGAFLITRANKKKQEQTAKQEWANNNSIPSKKENITVENDIKTMPINQKYAVVFLLAFIQGTSPQSAYSAEVNQIVQSVFTSLGLSNEEVERVIKASMNRDSDQEIDKAMNALKRIPDRDFIDGLYHKCMRIVEISGHREMVKIVNNIFEEIKSTK